jgi:hypothetical protein
LPVFLHFWRTLGKNPQTCPRAKIPLLFSFYPPSRRQARIITSHRVASVSAQRAHANASRLRLPRSRRQRRSHPAEAVYI